MTPEQMHARALAALTEEFSHPHEEPELDAQAFLAKLRASGWKPLPDLLSPAPERRASKEVAAKWSRQIRQDLGWPEPKTDGAA